MLVDHNAVDTKDIVTREEAEIRAYQISEISATYKLALRMGDTFLGEADIYFKYISDQDIWLNVSVNAIAGVTINGVDCGPAIKYDKPRLVVAARALKPGQMN